VRRRAKLAARQVKICMDLWLPPPSLGHWRPLTATQFASSPNTQVSHALKNGRCFLRKPTPPLGARETQPAPAEDRPRAEAVDHHSTT